MDKKNNSKEDFEWSDPGYFSLSRYDIFKMQEGLEEMVKTYSDSLKRNEDTSFSETEADNAFGRCEYDALTHENMFGMIENVGKMLASMDSDAKRKKMSYSISPLAQALVKKVSDNSGTTQGSIVELAPLLFGIFAQKSLHRRESALNKLEGLKTRISEALAQMVEMAPHLKTYLNHVVKVLDEVVAMEREAVENKNYSGVNISSHKHLIAISRENCPPPYHKEIEDLFEGDPYLQDIFNKIIQK